MALSIPHMPHKKGARGCNFGHFGMRPPWGRSMCAQGQLVVQMPAAAISRCNALSAMPIDNVMCNATPDSSGLEGPGNVVPQEMLRLIGAIVCSSVIFGCSGSGSGLVVATQPNAAQCPPWAPVGRGGDGVVRLKWLTVLQRSRVSQYLGVWK